MSEHCTQLPSSVIVHYTTFNIYCLSYISCHSELNTLVSISNIIFEWQNSCYLDFY